MMAQPSPSLLPNTPVLMYAKSQDKATRNSSGSDGKDWPLRKLYSGQVNIVFNGSR